MSNKRELCKKLNELCEKFDKKYYINSGGCCFVALTIAKELEKLGIKYSLKVTNYYPIGRKNFPENVIEANTCSHYYIHINYYGDINADNERYISTFTNINVKTLKYIYSKGYWNDDYNTLNNKKIIKQIKNIIYGK